MNEAEGDNVEPERNSRVILFLEGVSGCLDVSGSQPNRERGSNVFSQLVSYRPTVKHTQLSYCSLTSVRRELAAPIGTCRNVM